MQTARFVRQEGDQLELVLRIRQGRNVSFSFLRPDSPLYEYYRWLVHAQPQVIIPLESSPWRLDACDARLERLFHSVPPFSLVMCHGREQTAMQPV